MTRLRSNVVENYETQFVTFIESEMEQDLAHDLNHVFRVVKTAKLLSKIEGATRLFFISQESS